MAHSICFHFHLIPSEKKCMKRQPLAVPNSIGILAVGFFLRTGFHWHKPLPSLTFKKATRMQMAVGIFSAPLQNEKRH
jgi:hypothetical protein